MRLGRLSIGPGARAGQTPPEPLDIEEVVDLQGVVQPEEIPSLIAHRKMITQLQNKNDKLAVQLAQSQQEKDRLQGELDAAKAEVNEATQRVIIAEQQVQEAERSRLEALAGITEDERNMWKRRVRLTVMGMFDPEDEGAPDADGPVFSS